MQIKHTINTCTPKVNSTCCLKNGYVTHVGCLSKNNKKIQDHSPSMTLFKVSLQMILVPKIKMLRYLATLLSMTIQKRPNVHPFPSNDGASYQINDKIATSKGGGKAHLIPFE